jgi:hypothetical protein
MSPALDFFTNITDGPRRVRNGHNLGSATPSHHDVYYNPRLDPANFLEGPLSTNPATCLRQMLARPGIIVSVVFAQCYFRT